MKKFRAYSNGAGTRMYGISLSYAANTGFMSSLELARFCHGEVRNGGMPDWLFGRPFNVRSNDEGYLVVCESAISRNSAPNSRVSYIHKEGRLSVRKLKMNITIPQHNGH